MFLLAMQEGSCLVTSLPVLGFIQLCNFCQSIWYKVAPRFNLHSLITNDFEQFLDPLGFMSLFLVGRSSLWRLDRNGLLVLGLENIFSNPVIFLLILSSFLSLNGYSKFDALFLRYSLTHQFFLFSLLVFVYLSIGTLR